MKKIVKTLDLKSHTGKVYTLTNDLLSNGYFIHKHLRGWQLCKDTSANQVWWSSSLKNLDCYITRKIFIS